MQKDELFRELLLQGVREGVINAMKKVPREDFVLPEDADKAYCNYPLLLHEGQTISQPLTVALMTEWLDVRAGHKVLEVGAGSGYQAAILSVLAGPEGGIVTCEVRKRLYEFARKNLERYGNVKVVHADGSKGYVERNSLTSSNISKELRSFADDGKFDRIILTASAKKMPEALLGHLKEGGMAVLPVGDEMYLVERRNKNKFLKEMKGYFAFVPLVE